MRLRYLTAGESHGPCLTVIVEGLPAGLPVDRSRIDRDLQRRMGGYGRGGRMKIENDRVQVTAGVRFGRTLGSPVALVVDNKDYANWQVAMNPDGPHPGDKQARVVTRPRPGHADLAGSLKYGTHDARDVFERSSARETAARTAAGALAKALLAECGIVVTSRTVAVGDATAPEMSERDFERLVALDDDLPMRTLDEASRQAMIEAVNAARDARDSIGGVFEVLARGVPPGLGSCRLWDTRLEGRLGQALMSIHAVKAVEVGDGIRGAGRFGSEVHDGIFYDADTRRFFRKTNRAGGIEGGMTNGEEIRATAFLKPLSTLPKPLHSVDLVDKTEAEATVERTDTCVIPAAGIVGEAMMAIVLAEAFMEKFGGDSMTETGRNYRGYLEQVEAY